jgi:hypothetical protein
LHGVRDSATLVPDTNSVQQAGSRTYLIQPDIIS